MVQLRRRALLAGALALALGGGPAHRSAAAAAGFDPEAVVRRVEHLAILALAQAGERVVAAGERGRILFSDDGGATWKVGQTPTHHTLTSLAFSDAKVGFATGHQGTLLRTEDGGLTWKQAGIEMKQKPALFAVHMKGERGIAVGAYGAFLQTTDGGHNWQARAVGPADFDRHLTGIAPAGDARLVVAGEAGTLLASPDGGASWQVLKSPYAGSFFGALGMRGGAVIVFGMRGNAYRSADAGKSWQRVDLGSYKGALQGATELSDGSVVLTGAEGMIATSTDGGVTFAANPVPSRVTVTAVARTAKGHWLAAGPSGLRPVN
jgi:photosystem II stability/assembly factor-like uncharacterized protein